MTENQLQTSIDKNLMEDDIYKSLSRAAVFGCVFAVLGILGFWFAPLVALTFFGLVFSFVALNRLNKYPQELTGRPIAWFALLLSGFMTIGQPLYHAYIYATELPEGYERVSFSELKSPLGAPDYPPEQALALDGKKVFLKGYPHPSSVSAASAKHFVLVPDIATCCFGGQPPLTHMIEVNLNGDQSLRLGMFSKLRLAGTLRVDQNLKPVSGLNGVYYQLQVDRVVN